MSVEGVTDEGVEIVTLVLKILTCSNFIPKNRLDCWCLEDSNYYIEDPNDFVENRGTYGQERTTTHVISQFFETFLWCVHN